MPVYDRIAAFHDAMRAWRRDLHAHPETAFEEVRTAGMVAEALRSFGVDEVHEGLATTGVVGVLRAGRAERAIGLRADMDALDLTELNDVPWRSTHEGKMHACGHDGHTAMLLGAARYLAETRRFDGTVYLIFQPAEENVAGGRVMVEEGLFERFPCRAVYGMHNMPGIPAGQMAVRPGPMMASADYFEIGITGAGAHGAVPHEGIDPVFVGAQIVTGLQRIVARSVDPMHRGVLSVTQFHAGHTDNVIPERAVLRGTTRAFLPEVQDTIEREMKRVVEGTAAAHGASASFRYERRYPPTINPEAEAAIGARAGAAVVGDDNVLTEVDPVMGAEDFAWMLQAKPGCYAWIGNGAEEGGCVIHSPHYDFNDEILPIGASYWARLVEDQLA